MSSLGPDGTFLDETAAGGLDAATDLSAAPLWAAFRDRYTRARKRRTGATPAVHLWVEQQPSDRCLELLCQA